MTTAVRGGCGIFVLFVSFTEVEPIQAQEACPPPLSCAGPLSVCGKWEAIPNCTYPPWELCQDGELDLWPREAGATHMALLYRSDVDSARVLMWHHTARFPTEDDNEWFYPYWWDPVTFARSSLQSSDPVDRVKNLFCGAAVALGDGRLFVLGGQNNKTWKDTEPNSVIEGINTSFIFDPAAPTSWEEKEPMMPADPPNGRRWYPTGTLLDDSRVLAVSGMTRGTEDYPNKLAHKPEVYTLGSGWTTLSGAVTYEMTLYPYMHLLPGSGTKVAHVGPRFTNNQMQKLVGLEGANPTWQNHVSTSPNPLYTSGSVVFEATKTSLKVLNAGGFPEWNPGAFPYEGLPDNNPPGPQEVDAVNRAEVISYDPVTGTATRTAVNSMARPRFLQNMVVMPDGKVLVIGGGTDIRSASGLCSDAVYETEIWDPGTNPPGTGQWTQVAPMCGFRVRNQPRMYHSSALLLPDGRIISAGGECFEDCNRADIAPDGSKVCFSGDFHKPGYLFKATGQEIADADRPMITNPPKSIAYGEGMSFNRTTGDGAPAVCKVAFIRPGSTTHANNMDQRYVPVTFTDAPTITISATEMPDAKVAPPGYYMLFLVNTLNHPSHGKFVMLWSTIQSTVAHSNLTVNPDGTFDIDFAWRTTAKAVVGYPDAGILKDPSGNVVQPISQSVSSSPDSLSHTWHAKVSCIPGYWTYQVRSKRSKYVGDVLSVSMSTAKTFRVTVCLEP